MSTPIDRQIEQLHQEVEDARLLLTYAIESGKEELEDKTIQGINAASAFLSLENLPAASDQMAFESAYRELAQLVAPVSAASLSATDDKQGRTFPFFGWTLRSEAKIWSRCLWLYTGLLAVLIIAAENYTDILEEFYARDEQTENLFPYSLAIVLDNIIPFFYGALGAIAFLLRSAHEFLHKRTFDQNRIPEYYNRIFLGLVAGGTIELFVNQIATDDGVIELSASALAFLAGYSSDFLFSTIERVSVAILPKVRLDSIRRRPPGGSGLTITGKSLTELIDLLDKAETPEAKDAIKSVLKKL